ncbi:MAG: family 20 glycosylhydrolase [Algisphaera sp.]
MPDCLSMKIPLLPQPRTCEWTQEPLALSVFDRVQQRIDPQAMPHEQGYQLRITTSGVEIIGHDQAGLFYGEQTLKQMANLAGDSLCAVTLEDWPDFKVRGVMLDISRDRVPKMSELFARIDRLASWKINHVQLYIEHTIAYHGHKAVWKNSSPLTFEEIKQLDTYCQARHIDFVPCQNLFGHLHHWLTVDGYKHLAECPDGWETPWGYRDPLPFSLDPSNPESLELVRDLVDQLAPCCDSMLFNIGCDETLDIGQGKTKALCEEQGRASVYLDFLNKICAEVQRHGKTPMFWGDIVLHHPELIDRIPKDAVLLNWGYEASHPFMKQSKQFHEAGVRQYVCPGTSSWTSLTGRMDNAIENIRSAAEAGLKYQAEGFLNTDWGDYGHWHPFLTSWPAMAYGAAVSWSYDTNAANTNPANWLNAHVFQDETGHFGNALSQLGNLYQHQVPEMLENDSISTWWFDFLRHTQRTFSEGKWLTITSDNAAHVLDQLAKIEQRLSQANPTCNDAALSMREIQWLIWITRWVCEQAQADMRITAFKPEDWGVNASAETKAAFDALVTEYHDLWSQRSRPGGLKDSTQKIAQLMHAKPTANVV